jgi:sodium-dependent phosphate cotransporter
VTTRLRKILYALVALFLFILAIELMKTGARSLAPLLRESELIGHPINALGLGWLGAYIVLSGSPVAAAALGLYDGGALSLLDTFMMINGSRMGASFIVLFIGFLYMLRGHEGGRSLGMGLISLLTTWSQQLIALLLGYLILASGWLDRFRPEGGAHLVSALDVIYDPIVAWIRSWAPGWLVFAIGVGLIMLAFSLIDRALPEMSLSGTRFDDAPSILYRPAVMFMLGMAVTTVSMSVSVSLGLLVPLSARGYIRVENVIPYIMGANVTTFIDTLLISLLMDNPGAFTVVLVEMISVALASVILLAFSYRAFERKLLGTVGEITASRRKQAGFMLALVGMPIVLLLI